MTKPSDQEKISGLSLYLGICMGFISNHDLKIEHENIMRGIDVLLYAQAPRTRFSFAYGPVFQDDKYEVLLIQNRNSHKPRRMAICERDDDAKEIVAALQFAHQNNVI